MTTPLTKPLKRELLIQGRPFVLTLSPEGIKLTLKGKRKGQELRWEDLVSGEAALAVALNASLKSIPERGATTAAAQASTPGVAATITPAAKRGTPSTAAPAPKRKAKRKSGVAPERARSGRRP